MNIIERAIGLWPVAVSYAKAARDFVKSTGGKVVIAAIVVIVAGSITYSRGKSQGIKITNQKWEAIEEARKVEEDRESRLRAAKDKIAGDYVRQQVAEAGARAAELQKKVSHYEDSLRRRGKVGACVITDDDVRSLRNIR